MTKAFFKYFVLRASMFHLSPFANLAFVRTKPMPFSNRIYRLAATVAKVASRFSDITIVFQGHGDAFPRIGDGNLCSDLFLCFAKWQYSASTLLKFPIYQLL